MKTEVKLVIRFVSVSCHYKTSFGTDIAQVNKKQRIQFGLLQNLLFSISAIT